MKKLNMSVMLLMVAVLAMLVFPGASMADPLAAADNPAASTGAQGWDLALTIVLPIILAASSLLANFFEIKPTDPPAWAFVKRIINTLALNLSDKAGK